MIHYNFAQFQVRKRSQESAPRPLPTSVLFSNAQSSCVPFDKLDMYIYTQ